MIVIRFLISFFGKLILCGAAASAVITAIELIRYARSGKEGRR